MKQYYTPDISDIRVGYECETLEDLEWSETVITRHYDLSFINEWIVHSEIRTPYLTKEQIESEGWSEDSVLTVDDNDNDILNSGFSKYMDEDNWYSLIQYPDNKILIQKCWYRNQVTWLSQDLFYGYCPSINEFRYITKTLLKIK